jgi:aromatic-L-amino-acid decarboxylase
MTPEEFRRFGYELIDRIADYRAGIADRPVMAQVVPDEIKNLLPQSAPEDPQPVAEILTDLDRIIAGLSHWQHPRFFGYFPANALLAGVLGDLASTGLGVVGLSWQSAPALTELEEVVVDWIRQMLGLSEVWSGVIQDTASTNAVVALISARERATGYSMWGGGLQAEGQALALYVTEHAHSSVTKGALLAGFGREHVRTVPHDGSYAMRADALAEIVNADAAAGVKPCALVATTGTTATVALDPIRDVAEVARSNGLWLHVDAAMAGSAMILPECRWMWDGVEEADSLVVNLHKWLGVPFDCSIYFARDPEHLTKVMSTGPSYLRSNVDGAVKNLRNWGIPLGRRFRALKVWFVLREQGLAALRARLRRDIANAAWLAEAVRARPDWRVLAPVNLQTVCLRHEPLGLSGEALDAHTLGWANRINASGVGYLTPAVLDGRWMVRVAIGSEMTEREDVEATWLNMRREAETYYLSP